MSASIYYRYTINEKHVDVAAPSMFVEAMNKVFGGYPWRLDGGSVHKLQGMAALCCDGAEKNPYQVLITIIIGEGTDENNPIEVWPEY